MEGDDIALGLDNDEEEELEDDPDIWHDQQFED
jgi:hypothetical protein